MYTEVECKVKNYNGFSAKYFMLPKERYLFYC